MKRSISFALLSTLFLGISCQAQPQEELTANTLSSVFNSYWYAGKAEITSYELQQSRYGEIHNGHAVLIFVTEDFSKSKQVKLDDPQRAQNDKVGILKLNFTKKFNTGIYPYSMMQSTFTPVDRQSHPHSLKTTMSSQEWCGQTFTQFNLEQDKYSINSYSYFEQEGDKQLEIDKMLLEDEIWNLIRLDFKRLPVGTIKFIPSVFQARLLHKPLAPAQVNASLSEDGATMIYQLDYPKENRSLSITFEKVFPHKILSWQETTTGLGGKTLTTKATLKKTLHTDYWNKHRNKDAYLREVLGLK